MAKYLLGCDIVHPGIIYLCFESFLPLSSGLNINPNTQQDTQNYWVFGLCPSSGILKTRKHGVSEIGSVTVLRCGEETLFWVPYKDPLSPEDGNRYTSRNVVSSSI
jgi:hypothetical protein